MGQSGGPRKLLAEGPLNLLKQPAALILLRMKVTKKNGTSELRNENLKSSSSSIHEFLS